MESSITTPPCVLHAMRAMGDLPNYGGTVLRTGAYYYQCLPSDPLIIISTLDVAIEPNFPELNLAGNSCIVWDRARSGENF
jgi:hypothetical protein